ncbi:hypothetical protein BaRGS_00026183 [Batillaria attramentaria]|uniref:Transmembrane protein n=1 Tax=Batillaria attramentaria TaxID=370345 RepID=A0ABD0K6Z1_9CAEN
MVTKTLFLFHHDWHVRANVTLCNHSSVKIPLLLETVQPLCLAFYLALAVRTPFFTPLVFSVQDSRSRFQERSWHGARPRGKLVRPKNKVFYEPPACVLAFFMHNTIGPGLVFSFDVH